MNTGRAYVNEGELKYQSRRKTHFGIVKRVMERQHDLSALDGISAEMRKRLRVVIEQKHPNFVLVGSDPAEKGGCCPSNEVGHANQLVAGGILESWRPCCSKDACPGTFYAFQGERVPDTSPTEFKTNEELRKLVLERLSSGNRPGSGLRGWLQVLLLLFVAVCIGLLIAGNRGGGAKDADNAELAIKTAGEAKGDGYLVCVVKTAQACAACESMQAFSIKMLDQYYQGEVSRGLIRFETIPAEGPQNRTFREEHGILATTLVLMEVRSGVVTRQKILNDAWQFLQKEDEFTGMLRQELDLFMGKGK